MRGRLTVGATGDPGSEGVSLTDMVVCQNCLVIAGASQQCFQCVEKCEKTPSKDTASSLDGGRKLFEFDARPGLVPDCSSFRNT